jgi:peptidoglycan hydrolase-like protein with peptidoglycan-binding domain
MLKLTLSVVILLVAGTLVQAATPNRRPRKGSAISRSEILEAKRLLSKLGYWTGPADGVLDGKTRQALIAFQKVSGIEATGRLTRDELELIRNATAPEAKDPGYRHVEIDLDRQVLFLVDDEGKVAKVLPVSTGGGQHYHQNGMSGIAYTPRGRFRVYAKAMGWKKSPLGMLYFPNYFSDGLAIHGNSEVPVEPKSHGCVRIPTFASSQVSKMMPIGTIVLIYDTRSFVSAKDWVEEQRPNQVDTIQ